MRRIGRRWAAAAGATWLCAGCAWLAPRGPAPADGARAFPGPARPMAEPADGPEQAAREEYTAHGFRTPVDPRQDPWSTFSVDVDTGSYTVVRRKLNEGFLPPPAAVRVEELVNYFRQDYPDPDEGPFAVVSEAAPSPFRAERVLLRIGLQGRRVSAAARRPANLVFLVDTSGSMRSPDKLGLVRQSLEVLVDHLRPDDRVAICTYAGSVELVLPPTPADEQARIRAALAGLEAGGSTAMGSGIQLAYELAAREARPGVSSRVIVCSDGDANVGPTSHEQLLALIAAQRARGITLGTVGFGMGNYRDTLMERLADEGDGSYAYVDSLLEARRLFGEDLTQSLELLARDVKVQVAFDPARVRSYRLLGYENRAIHDEDFRVDRVDAGEVGAGHTVTALYELELVPASAGPPGEVRLRWKDPEEGPQGPAVERAYPLTPRVAPSFAAASQRFRFTACVGELAEVLRGSPWAATPLERLVVRIEESLDPRGDDREHDLLALAQRAAAIQAHQRAP